MNYLPVGFARPIAVSRDQRFCRLRPCNGVSAIHTAKAIRYAVPQASGGYPAAGDG
ncbi:hypothetical protein KCP75_09660 [Salmonella enterica subsp. enterica]|nr:hypothetical protein KCP75_09660 [Salmonella enterica subsp. enterica]